MKFGETLYSIARRYRLHHREVAAWNGIGQDFLIHAGERLRLTPPPGGRAPKRTVSLPSPAPRASAGDPARAPPEWQWPVHAGQVAGNVRQPSGGVGLRIDGVLNQPIVAAADGRVVYTGSGLRGYGQLVIINHERGWLTAYGYNALVNVREGEAVRAGQVVGAMGMGPGRQAMLYFEVRLEGKPIDPLSQLPPR